MTHSDVLFVSLQRERFTTLTLMRLFQSFKSKKCLSQHHFPEETTNTSCGLCVRVCVLERREMCRGNCGSEHILSSEPLHHTLVAFSLNSHSRRFFTLELENLW